MHGGQPHPFSGCQRPPSHGGGLFTSHPETLLNLIAGDELLTTLGDLGVTRSNEDSVQYAARMAARESQTGRFGRSQGDHLKLTPDAVSSPTLLSPMSCAAEFSGHGPEYAVNTSTFVPLRTSVLPFANYEPAIVFAATAASKIDVAPHFPAHPTQSSPPPIPPTPVEQADADHTAWETIIRTFSDYLEAHPEPIVGSIDNPFPSLDKYGLKGVSILSIFFDYLDADTFTCRLCNYKCDSIDNALEHQRAARHG